jgi:hypothetical protein
MVVFRDMSVKEEILTILPLKEETQGQEVYHALRHIKRKQLPVYKLVLITTYRAPSMTGKNNRFLSLCTNDDDFADFRHSFIHSQVLIVQDGPSAFLFGVS